MTPQAASAEAKAGKLRPVYVVLGEERLLRERIVAELRAASLGSGIAAFNEDKFTAGETDVDTVLSAVRTVPMMAPRRFVLVRSAERWDAGGGDDEGAKPTASPLDCFGQSANPRSSAGLDSYKIANGGRRRLFGREESPATGLPRPECADLRWLRPLRILS